MPVADPGWGRTKVCLATDSPYAFSKHKGDATDEVRLLDIYSIESCGGNLLCRNRSAPRRGSVGSKLHLRSGLPECLWRWRVAERPHRRSEGWRICHHTIRRHIVSLRSVRKKSPTSACRRSLSSTRRTPRQPAKKLPSGEVAQEVAQGVAEVAQGAAEAAAAVVAAAACRGDPAESARLELSGYLARRRASWSGVPSGH
jgi:hypothetical protein